MFMCAHPECSHREQKRVLLGKASICYACGGKYILNYEHLRRAKPHCGCMNGKATSEDMQMADIAEQIVLDAIEESKI